MLLPEASRIEKGRTAGRGKGKIGERVPGGAPRRVA